MKITLIIITFIFSIFILYSCKKEELKVQEIPLSDTQIMNFFEFENGDRWFVASFENYEQGSALYFQHNNTTNVLNYFNSSILSFEGIYMLNQNQYVYQSDDYLYEIKVNNKIESSKLPLFYFRDLNFLCLDPLTKKIVFYERDGTLKLYKYNGNTFEVINSNIKDFPISNSYIAIDSKSGIWISNDSRLYYYLGSNYTKYDVDGSLSELVVDDSSRIFGISNCRLYTITNNKIVKVNYTNSEFQDVYIRSLKKYNYNNLWIIGEDSITSIYKYNIAQNSMEKIVDCDYKAKIFAGGNYQGIYCLNKKKVYEIVGNILVDITK